MLNPFQIPQCGVYITFMAGRQFPASVEASRRCVYAERIPVFEQDESFPGHAP